MSTLIENINQACSDFQAIKLSLINKNLVIPNHTPTSQYASLIDSLDTRNIQDFQEWLMYGGIDYTLYNSLDEVINSNDLLVLLNTEASAAYAAFLKESIATKIKNTPMALKKALLSNYSYMFINSSFEFEENIFNALEKNEPVGRDNYIGTVEFSADRCTHPIPGEINDSGYYGWMAFNGSHDTEDLTKTYYERNIWSAFGTNQWVQYKYDTPKFLYCVRVYSLRDNAPGGIIISGSNDGESFTTIKEQSLSGIIGANHYDEIICSGLIPYKYFRFTITESVNGGSCDVGEIELYTFKED